jgi:cystathionine gamma-synthase
VEALELAIGGLEGGPTLVFSSGMAAAAAVLDLVPVGGHVSLPESCYHGVASLVEGAESRGRWRVSRISLTDTDGWLAAVAASDLVWLESPSNPLLEVADLARITGASDCPAVLAVDATLASPMGAGLLGMGVDIVMHSATKFIGGHSDLLAGSVSFLRQDLGERLSTARSLGGGFPGALETFLALRGIRTLPLRMERAAANAAGLAQRLESHRAVTRVRYPGSGAMVSFEVAGGDENAERVCQTVALVAHATSLGGVETSLERRSGKAGGEHLPAGLIRMSVGIEAVEDLWVDLVAALDGLDTL